MKNRFVWAGSLGGIASVIVLFITGNMPIMLLTGAAVFAMFSLIMKPDKKQDAISVILSEEKSFESVLSEASTFLDVAQNSSKRIQNDLIREKSREMCSSVHNILEELGTHPEKKPVVKKFLSYYLPTLAGVLSRYERIESNNAVSMQIQEKIIDYLDSIGIATKKLHANMFEDELLDMSLDMEVMTQLIKQEGLIDDENNIKLPVDKDKIELTLK